MSGTIGEIVSETLLELAADRVKQEAAMSLAAYTRIMVLREENAKLRRLVNGMAEQIYVQSNLLSRCAERSRKNSDTSELQGS
jgi:hypothetical protein